MRRPLFVVLLLGAVLVVPGTASASMRVASNARHATLKVVAGGAAEVDWVQAGGGRGSVVIYPNGSRRFGAHLKGRDVSFATTDVSLPMARVTKQTPNGRYWALQAWRRLRTGPVELRFSRWQGAPTLLTLDAVCCKWRSENIVGQATFHGRPIYGYRATRTGNPLDKYGRNVYLDTYRHNRWQRMMGILTHRPTGKFSLWIRPYWRGTAYRGRIIGPNWGRTLAPDAQASALTSR
jgi:hypothetical protein